VKAQYTTASTDPTHSTFVWTEATIQKRGDEWRVIQVEIRLDGDDQPLVVSAAAI
jgi:hypothetical protein